MWKHILNGVKLVALTWLRLRKARIVIVFDHGRCGGATSYIYGQTKHLKQSELALVVSPDESMIKRGYRIAVAVGGKNVPLFGVVVPTLFMLERVKARVCKIVVNELVGWNGFVADAFIDVVHLEEVLKFVLNYRQRTGAKMIAMLHDYYCLCPVFNLMKEGIRYCSSEYSMEECPECLQNTHTRMINSDPNLNVRDWRRSWQKFFESCDEIRAFSNDTKMRFERCFPTLRTTVVPHQCLVGFDRKPKLKFENIVIGVVGHCSVTKGKNKVLELARYLKAKGHDEVRIVIVGSMPEDRGAMPNNVCVLGGYCPKDLPGILEENGVNLIFFASVWPETFSYVTSEMMALNMPIVCYGIGAPAERVAKYARGEVILDFSIETTWKTIVHLYERMKQVEES